MEEDTVKIKKKIKLVPVIILAAILIVGGVVLYLVLSKNNSSEGEKETNPTPTVTPTPGSSIKVVDINSDTRPYAVMINCLNEALPQAGVKEAYMVYEILVEYGITRMIAFYKDADVAKIGSARSARDQFLAYVYENDAIYVHAGGAPETLTRISKEKIDDIDVDGQYGQRDKSLKRAWEHTLFTNTTLLAKGVKNKGLRDTTTTKPLLTYSVDELDLSKYQTTPANKVSIKYSNYRTSIYEYDKDNLNYLRFMNSKKNTDLVTGEQYRVKNIIAYGVKHDTYTAHGYSGYQRLHNIGTGEGYYITDGLALPITWEKKDEKSRTVYKIKETGEELKVNDGNTYIQIYPSNGGKLTIS